jgi:prepilin-type N-terminal cleavage/methylation domain-containing protein
MCRIEWIRSSVARSHFQEEYPLHSRSKAFTLIELLVVIAIIAILAAILFPVFAQAKESAKRTKTLAEAKQVGTAMVMYTTDADDTFPIMHSVDPATGTYLHSANGIFNYRLPAVPAGWGPNSVWREADSVAWQNSTLPYSKNGDILGGAGLNVWTSGFDYSAAPGGLPVTSLSANGLLNTWSATGVAAPSQLPLLWFGNGKEAYRGYGYTNPYLRCTQTGTVGAPAAPCRFNPGGRSQLNGSAARAREDTYEFTFEPGNDTVQVFSGGNIVVRADTSARFLKMGSNSGTEAEARETRAINEPGFIYTVGSNGDRGGSTPAGYVWWPMRCVSSAGAPHYQSMFRPDSEFNYGFGTTGDNAPCFQ